MGGISIMSWIWCNKKRLRWDEIPIFLVHTKRSLPFLLIWVRISFSAPATSQRFFYSKQLSFACISVRELQPSISIKLNQKATKTNIHLGTSAQNFVIISHRNPASFALHVRKAAASTSLWTHRATNCSRAYTRPSIFSMSLREERNEGQLS